MPTITTRTEPRFTTRLGTAGRLVMAGRLTPMPSRTRCFLAWRGYRCIARSPWSWSLKPARNGNDMDNYADDSWNWLRSSTSRMIHVGHSTGGVRWLVHRAMEPSARQGAISAVPPLMLKTKANGWHADQLLTSSGRASLRLTQFWKDLICPSTATTGLVPKCRKACASRSGCKACWQAFPPLISASRRFPRPTRLRI